MFTFPHKGIDLDKDTRESLIRCLKKPEPVMAVQIQQFFTVQDAKGNDRTGRPGDYLISNIKGELDVCDREVFESSYDLIP